MKTLLLATAATLFAGTALAADPFAPATGDGWGGVYAGVHYGAGTVDARGPAGRAETDIDAYGLHGGYLHDFDGSVLGAELDYDRLDGEGGKSADLTRLRARAGMAHGRVLPYLSLGLAHYSDDTYSDTGITYGIGADVQLTGTVLLGLDYSRDRIDNVDGTGADLEIDSLRIRASFRF